MRFSWISENRIDEQLLRFCIDLEYLLRERITKFLIQRMDDEQINFNQFLFEVDLSLGQISLAPETKALVGKQFCEEFDREINLGYTQSLFSRSPFNAA